MMTLCHRHCGTEQHEWYTNMAGNDSAFSPVRQTALFHRSNELLGVYVGLFLFGFISPHLWTKQTRMENRRLVSFAAVSFFKLALTPSFSSHTPDPPPPSPLSLWRGNIGGDRRSRNPFFSLNAKWLRSIIFSEKINHLFPTACQNTETESTDWG